MFHLRRDTVIGEQKSLEIRAQRNFAVAKNDELRAVADFLQRRAFLTQLQAALVNVIKFREQADFHRAFGRFEFTNNDFKQRGFAESIASGNADSLAVLEGKIKSA